MDREGFVNFLRKKKKSARTVADYVNRVQQYEAFLREHKNGRNIEGSRKRDLHDFERWGEQQKLKINRYLWGIKEYYSFTSKEALRLEANAMIGARYLAQFKLKDFVGLKPEYIQQLKKEGIVNAKDMLYAGLTKGQRQKLSKITGIPYKDIMDLVKLSDQARIGGHKKVRARLYHEAGLDTMDKMAACDATQIRQMLSDFIRKTGFKGIPPTLGEAQNTVEMARYLQRIVKY